MIKPSYFFNVLSTVLQYSKFISFRKFWACGMNGCSCVNSLSWMDLFQKTHSILCKLKYSLRCWQPKNISGNSTRSVSTYNNSDWAALYSNLSKSQSRLGMAEKFMGNTGALFKARDMMYKVVVQVVLLYGSEIWVVTDAIMKVL